ncbi:hypothetical protein GEMRC1_011293 [Eukaryota sp. GEM-RC1]
MSLLKYSVASFSDVKLLTDVFFEKCSPDLLSEVSSSSSDTDILSSALFECFHSYEKYDYLSPAVLPRTFATNLKKLPLKSVSSTELADESKPPTLSSLTELSLKLHITTLSHFFRTDSTLTASLLDLIFDLLQEIQQIVGRTSSPSSPHRSLLPPILLSLHGSSPHFLPLSLGLGDLPLFLSLLITILNPSSSHSLSSHVSSLSSLNHGKIMTHFLTESTPWTTTSNWYPTRSSLLSCECLPSEDLTNARVTFSHPFLFIVSPFSLIKMGTGLGHSEQGKVYAKVLWSSVCKDDFSEHVPTCSVYQGDLIVVIGKFVAVFTVENLKLAEYFKYSEEHCSFALVTHPFEFYMIKQHHVAGYSHYYYCSINDPITSYRDLFYSNNLKFSLIPSDRHLFDSNQSPESFPDVSFFSNGLLLIGVLRKHYHDASDDVDCSGFMQELDGFLPVIRLPPNKDSDHLPFLTVYDHQSNLWIALTSNEGRNELSVKQSQSHYCLSSPHLSIKPPQSPSPLEFADIMFKGLFRNLNFLKYFQSSLAGAAVPLPKYFNDNGQALRSKDLFLDLSLKNWERMVSLLDLLLHCDLEERDFYILVVLRLIELHVGHLIANSITITSLDQNSEKSKEVIQKIRLLLLEVIKLPNQALLNQSEELLSLGFTLFFPSESDKSWFFLFLINHDCTLSSSTRVNLLSTLCCTPFSSTMMVTLSPKEAKQLEQELSLKKDFGSSMEELVHGLWDCDAEGNLLSLVVKDLCSRVFSFTVAEILKLENEQFLIDFLNFSAAIITKSVELLKQIHSECFTVGTLDTISQKLNTSPIRSVYSIIIDSLDYINITSPRPSIKPSIITLTDLLSSSSSLLSSIHSILNPVPPSLDDLSLPIKPMSKAPVLVSSKVMESRTHPYQNDEDYELECIMPGVEYMMLEFDPRCAMENRYDYLTIHTGPAGTGNLVGKYSGRNHNDYPSTPIKVVSNQLYFSFHSDGSNTDWGFLVSVSGFAPSKPRLPSYSWLFSLASVTCRVLGKVIGCLIAGPLVSSTEKETVGLVTKCFPKGITDDVDKLIKGEVIECDCMVDLELLSFVFHTYATETDFNAVVDLIFEKYPSLSNWKAAFSSIPQVVLLLRFNESTAIVCLLLSTLLFCMNSNQSVLTVFDSPSRLIDFISRICNKLLQEIQLSREISDSGKSQKSPLIDGLMIVSLLLTFSSNDVSLNDVLALITSSIKSDDVLNVIRIKNQRANDRAHAFSTLANLISESSPHFKFLFVPSVLYLVVPALYQCGAYLSLSNPSIPTPFYSFTK